MMQIMDYALGIISTTPLQQHVKNLSGMVYEEYCIDVVESSGRIEIVGGLHHRTVISKINKEFSDTYGPLIWPYFRIAVVVFYERTGSSSTVLK